MSAIKQRNLTLDIIRIAALFCVVSVHFFLNSGFYDIKVSGLKSFFMIIPQSFFLICVPLFILLTGYLQNNKQLSKKYYKGIKKILIVYLIASILYSLFSALYLDDPMNIKIFLLNLLKYHGSPYGWYIEMYIGLFLLIPFLNIIFNNLDKKGVKILIITLIFMTILPSIMNIYNFDKLSWWLKPSSSKKYAVLVPKWWKGIYPLTYYFIGAYISKYKPKISIKKNILSIIIVTILFASFNYYRSYGAKYVCGLWNDYPSPFVLILSTLVFILLLNIRIKNSSKKDYYFKIVSDSVLGAYLVSRIFDVVVYDKLSRIVIHAKDRILYAPITVLIVFVSSLFTSILIEYIYRLSKKK